MESTAATPEWVRRDRLSPLELLWRLAAQLMPGILVLSAFGVGVSGAGLDGDGLLGTALSLVLLVVSVAMLGVAVGSMQVAARSFRRGAVALREGDQVTATAEFRRCRRLRDRRTRAAATLNLGMERLRAGDHEGAQALFVEGTRRARTPLLRNRFFYEIGMLRARTGDTDAAVAALSRAAESTDARTAAAAWAGLSAVATAAGRTDESAAHATSAAAVAWTITSADLRSTCGPPLATVVVRVVGALRSTGQEQLAVALLEHITEVSAADGPDSLDAAVLLLVLTDSYARAIEVGRYAVSNAGERDIGILANCLGLAYARTGDRPAAAAWFERATRSVVPSAKLAGCRNLGKSLLRGGDHAGARPLLEAACRSRERSISGGATALLGEVEWREGHPDRAEQRWAAAEGSGSTDARQLSAIGRARLHLARGDKAVALELLQDPVESANAEIKAEAQELCREASAAPADEPSPT